MNELEKNEVYDNSTFEEIKHIDEDGNEYWYARELMKTLKYAKWENFKKLLKKQCLLVKIAKLVYLNTFLTTGGC